MCIIGGTPLDCIRFNLALRSILGLASEVGVVKNSRGFSPSWGPLRPGCAVKNRVCFSPLGLGALLGAMTKVNVFSEWSSLVSAGGNACPTANFAIDKPRERTLCSLVCGSRVRLTRSDSPAGLPLPGFFQNATILGFDAFLKLSASHIRLPLP
jgi:hypothetical protein